MKISLVCCRIINCK